MNLISKETLLTHLQRAEMASDVRLPIEFFRDLVYQAMPRTWVGLTNKELADCWETIPELAMRKVEAKLKDKNT
jgi:hypothetical protein